MRKALSSLRTKALLLGVLPAFLLSLATGGYLINARLSDMENALESRGQALASELAANSFYGLFSGDNASLVTTARSFLERPDVAGITIFDDLRNPVIQLGARTSGEGLNLYQFEAAVRGTAPVAIFGAEPPGSDLANAELLDLFGYAHLTLKGDTLSRLRYEIISTGVLLLIFGIMIISLLTLLLSRQIVLPVLALSDAIKRLQGGDLDVQVEQKSSGELGVLERGFNDMARRMALTQEELLKEVSETTSDLQLTMDALEVRNIELDLARKKALKASQAKSDFLASMSHEIRTPMNGVMGFARLLAKSKLDPKQLEQLQSIRESADTLLRVINDVLDFSKLESGQVSFHPQPFRLRLLVTSIMKMFDPQAHDKGLELVSMVYDDVPDYILGDPLRIRQILTNLIGNAIKFTLQGKVIVRVMLEGEADSPDDQLCFSVQDTGIGIPSDSLEKLFLPFTQAETSTDRIYGGTGLGLSISKRLVDNMGGLIGAESEPGQGSSFWFTLPLHIAEESDESVSDSSGLHRGGTHEQPDTAELDISQLRILVADDNKINLQLIDSVLSERGARVTLAEDGKQALALAIQSAFDIILMDIHMPGMNGMDAAKHIRYGDNPNVSTPIIAITADVMSESHRLIFDAGMGEILTKPIEEENLVATIREHVYNDQAVESPLLERSPEIPASAESAPPVRDMASALRATGGNAQVAEDLFNMLMAEADDNLLKITELLQEKSWDALWNEVHRFQGSAAVCGAPALHSTLLKIEAGIKNRDTPGVTSWILDLKKQIDLLSETREHGH